jgi:hypothetical protein
VAVLVGDEVEYLYKGKSFTKLKKIKKRGEIDTGCNYNGVILFLG